MVIYAQMSSWFLHLNIYTFFEWEGVIEGVIDISILIEKEFSKKQQ